MAQQAPGKHFRKGMTLIEITAMFPDDATAEKWFAETRWPNGPHCPKCGSTNVQTGASHKTMPYRCRDCSKRFSVRTGTMMDSSNISYRLWAICNYLLTTSLKSVSSMKLHRDLGVTQKTAWFMLHRMRGSWNKKQGQFSGPVEVDEAYMGGKESRKHADKKLHAGRGTVGKVPVIGALDRKTNHVNATVTDNATRETLHGFVNDNAQKGATVYTDEAKAYKGMSFKHEAVKHSVGEYVNGEAHTNGIESFWATLKRAHKGTFHKISHKHLQRYVDEFTGRHNSRPLDTIDQMRAMVSDGKTLRYQDLIADNGHPSGARS